jgi:uncharacterized protein YciI
MGTYVYIGHDGPKGAELRKTDVRERHLANLEGLDAAGRIAYAGPLRDEAGNPCGSLVVFSADDFQQAKGIAESDPYLVEGVFESVEVFDSMQVYPKT